MKDYIAVDWGSTQLRGWLIRNGQCVGTKQLPLGITRLNGRSPATYSRTRRVVSSERMYTLGSTATSYSSQFERTGTTSAVTPLSASARNHARGSST